MENMTTTRCTITDDSALEKTSERKSNNGLTGRMQTSSEVRNRSGPRTIYRSTVQRVIDDDRCRTSEPNNSNKVLAIVVINANGLANVLNDCGRGNVATTLS